LPSILPGTDSAELLLLEVPELLLLETPELLLLEAPELLLLEVPELLLLEVPELLLPEAAGPLMVEEPLLEESTSLRDDLVFRKSSASSSSRPVNNWEN
jgi:hypothetical protein